MSELLKGNSVGTGAGIISWIPKNIDVPEGFVKPGEVFSKAEAPEFVNLISEASREKVVIGASEYTTKIPSYAMAWETDDGQSLYISTGNGTKRNGVYRITTSGDELISNWTIDSGTNFEVTNLCSVPGSNGSEMIIVWCNNSYSNTFVISKSTDSGITWTHTMAKLGVNSNGGTSTENFKHPNYNSYTLNIEYTQIRWCGDRWVMILTTNKGGAGQCTFLYSKDGINWTYCGAISHLNGSFYSSLDYHPLTNTVYFTSGTKSNATTINFTWVVVNDSMIGDLSVSPSCSFAFVNTDTSWIPGIGELSIIGDFLMVKVGEVAQSVVVVGLKISRLGGLDLVQRQAGDPWFDFSKYVQCYVSGKVRTMRSEEHDLLLIVSNQNSGLLQRVFCVKILNGEAVVENKIFPASRPNYNSLVTVNGTHFNGHIKMSGLYSSDTHIAAPYVSISEGRMPIMLLK